MSADEPGSPARKRQRLSSPQYDEQVEAMDEEDFSALDQLEMSLSQSSSQREIMNQKLILSPRRVNEARPCPTLKSLPSEKPRSAASQAERVKRVREMEEAMKENQCRRKVPTISAGPSSSPGPANPPPRSAPMQRTRSVSSNDTVHRQPREDNEADNPFKPSPAPQGSMPANQSGFAPTSQARFLPALQMGFASASQQQRTGFAPASQAGFASASHAGFASSSQFIPLKPFLRPAAVQKPKSMPPQSNYPGSSKLLPPSSPVQGPERDYDSWFDSSNIPPVAGFQAAGAALSTGFTSAKAGFSKPAATGFQSAGAGLTNVGVGFTGAITARAAVDFKGKGRAVDREEEPEQDYSSWFDSTNLPPEVSGFQSVSGFQRAGAAPAFESASVAVLGFQKAGAAMGFSSAAAEFSRPSVAAGPAKPTNDFTVSTAALKAAEERMKRIEAEVESALANGEPAAKPPIPSRSNSLTSSARAAENTTTLSPFSSALNTLAPETPTPAGFTRPKAAMRPMGLGNKQFKSPLMVKPPNLHRTSLLNTPSASSPLNPARNRFAGNPQQPHPLAASPVVSTFTQPLFSTPRKAFAPPTSFFLTPRTPGTPTQNQSQRRKLPTSQFKTPFKAGMQPGESGRATLQETTRMQLEAKNAERMRLQALVAGTSTQPAPKTPRQKFFNLAKSRERKSLLESGLVPQSFYAEDLEALGVDFAELSMITAEIAAYYSFHTTSPTLVDEQDPAVRFGPEFALTELLEKGCKYATKPWVDNHWSLILWKLAGMVALDPDSEAQLSTKRWCWAEVMRQLLYRYERELNGGSRPPLRKIAAQDSPSSAPMVLCISKITWGEVTIGDDGLPVEPHPELELTDGWYRMRAEVDVPLARAAKRGLLRVGRKIAVAGCKLDTERKDASEILEAYGSIKLVLSGNSSHLAPWHAKLGFMETTPIATLNSLSARGGAVALMDIIVTKMYPIAYLEFIEEEDGTKSRIGPRNANEEAQVDERWKQRRELEETQLRAVFDKKAERFYGYAERLEEKAGARFKPGDDDYAPDNIDNLYEDLDLEDASQASKVIARLNTNQCGWLARFIREQIERDRERNADEVEQELSTSCPPRNVRNFRILIVEDAMTCRKASLRNAQLTVWDALTLTTSEGGDGGRFAIGERYKVTSVIPTQLSAWMDCGEGSEVFLSTRRDSRWTKVKF